MLHVPTKHLHDLFVSEHLAAVPELGLRAWRPEKSTCPWEPIHCAIYLHKEIARHIAAIAPVLLGVQHGHINHVHLARTEHPPLPQGVAQTVAEEAGEFGGGEHVDVEDPGVDGEGVASSKGSV